jgi:hypothetical protein
VFQVSQSIQKRKDVHNEHKTLFGIRNCGVTIMIRTILKRTICTPATLLAIIVLCGAMCANTDYDNGPLYAFEYADALGIVIYFVPIAAALPVCYIQRYLSREDTSRLLLFRGSRSRYIAANIISTILVGMIVMAAAFCLFAMISFLKCWPDGVWAATDNGELPYWDEYNDLVYPEGQVITYVKVGYLDILLNDDYGLVGTFAILSKHHLLLFLAEGLVMAIQGAIYATVALGCFAFTSNQYVSLAFPFLLRTGLAFLGSSTGQFWLDPGQLGLSGAMSETMGGGTVYLFSAWCVVTLLFGGAWGLRQVRRSRHG